MTPLSPILFNVNNLQIQNPTHLTPFYITTKYLNPFAWMQVVTKVFLSMLNITRDSAQNNSLIIERIYLFLLQCCWYCFSTLHDQILYDSVLLWFVLISNMLDGVSLLVLVTSLVNSHICSCMSVSLSFPCTILYRYVY